MFCDIDVDSGGTCKVREESPKSYCLFDGGLTPKKCLINGILVSGWRISCSIREAFEEASRGSMIEISS